MRAPVPRTFALATLVALAACGRIGYDPAVTTLERDGGADVLPGAGSDAPPDLAPDIGFADARDATLPDSAPDAPPPDAGPDTRPPDVIPADVRPPDTTPDTPPDTRPPDMAPDLARDVARDLSPDAPAAGTVTATGQTATVRQGGSGAAASDLCPDGSLLIGYEGTHSSNPNYPWIQSMVGVCATVVLPPEAPPPAWALTRMPARGNTGGVAWSRLCPAGHVLVGFDGNAAGWIGQLVFVCASIARAPSGGVVLGAEIELDDVGGAAQNDFPQTQCPGGQVARGAEIRSGSFLEAFGLICGTPVLR